jgi:hypothetical protein
MDFRLVFKVGLIKDNNNTEKTQIPLGILYILIYIYIPFIYIYIFLLYIS